MVISLINLHFLAIILESKMLESQSNPLKQWFSTCGRDFRGGHLPFFWGSRELLINIFIITSRFYILYMEPVFFIAKIIGSPGYNSRLHIYTKLCD